MLRISHVLTCVIFPKPYKIGMMIIPAGIWVTEELSNLPKVTWLGKCGADIWTHATNLCTIPLWFVGMRRVDGDRMGGGWRTLQAEGTVWAEAQRCEKMWQVCDCCFEFWWESNMGPLITCVSFFFHHNVSREYSGMNFSMTFFFKNVNVFKWLLSNWSLCWVVGWGLF